MTAVKEEIQFVLDTIEPAVASIIELAQAVVGSADGEIVDTINSLISELEELSTTALEPIQEALNKLL